MFAKDIYVARRRELCRRVGKGLILLPGNVESPFNYPNNTYHFRQDSTFLYYFGHSVPSLVGVIDVESGVETLYGDDFTVDDIIWMGPQPTIRDFAEQVGVAEAKPMASLAADIQRAIALGREVHYLPPYRGETKLMLSDLLGVAPSMLHARKSLDLLFAVAEMREKKSAEEIAALEEALQEKRIRVSVAGSIAEAAADITQIFSVAQRTADLYLHEIASMKEDTEKECARMLQEARDQAEMILAEAQSKRG